MNTFFSLLTMVKTVRVMSLVKTLAIFVILIGAGPVRLAESRPSWQEEWEKTVEAAKKEGQVTVYISGYGAILDTGLFQKAYPGIKVVGVTGRGYQVVQRILTERRAHKYLADVTSTGFSSSRTLYKNKALDPFKPALILPEVVDESKWYNRKHIYIDPESQYVFRYAGASQFGSISYNTKLVNPKEFNSFWDFLKPKWKGKLLVRDVRVPGIGSDTVRFFYHHPELGPKYIKQLFGGMDATLFRGRRRGPDWLAAGKFPICFFCSGIDTAKGQGLPVDNFALMKEGAALSSLFGTITFVNKAPHPNAAKVFINWFLSRDGQSALQTVMASGGGSNVPDSLRVDISKDDVPPRYRRSKGVKYLDVDIQGRLEMRPVLKIMKRALVEAKKR